VAKQLAWCRKRKAAIVGATSNATSNGSDLDRQRDSGSGSGSGSGSEGPADQRAEPAWKREDREDHRLGGGAHRR
jgi:hypothetical protein